MKSNATAYTASFCVSVIACVACTDQKSGNPLLGLGLISLVIVIADQLLNVKNKIITYAFSALGILLGEIVRIIFDSIYKLYDHNLFPIEIVFIMVASSAFLFFVYLVDILISKIRRG